MTTSAHRDAESWQGRIGDVLTLFRREDRLTRAEVMRRTGLARSTVQQRIDTLLETRLLLPAEDEAPTRGRPAGQFAFNRELGVLLIADVGATAVRCALCDLRGTVRLDRSMPADVASGPEVILKLVQEMFVELLDEAGRDVEQVFGIGVAVPGPVDVEHGWVVSPPIMTGWDRYDIPAWFADHYPCPVLVDKDVNAMAFGEHRTNYPDVTNLLMLKIGTGVGAGMVTDGRLRRGADGAAGDIGHIVLPPIDGVAPPQCRCGNTGCVEAYASGWALVRDLRQAGADVARVDDAVALIRSGDTRAVQMARRSGRVLGGVIADAVSLLNPRVVVIGGQLSHADEQLFAGIREMVYRRSLPLATRNLQIVSSRLGQRAGSIGLALLLADMIFAPDRLDTLDEWPVARR